jgi:signal transduction histidine kinase
MKNLDKEARDIELEYKDVNIVGLINTLREKEVELKAAKLKNEFFGNISHEFKTPLNVLIGAIQVIELYTLNGTIIDPEEKLTKYINTMKQNSYRILRLINNIIDLSRIDSNYLELEMHNYDLISMIDGIISSIDIYAKAKAIKIKFIKKWDKKLIACDADKLEKIILNLLSNALKFTDENGTILVVIEERNNLIYISVEDDGIGIPKDKLELIFNRFRQVERSFTRNREGSGIGLALVKALVEIHHGKISVESEYRKGSKFTVELPAIVLEDEIDRRFYMNFEDSRQERIRIELSDI